jgi:SulP family sulfate permease
MGRFYRVGGGNRIAGFLLAVATAGLLVVGAGPIAFLREFHCLRIFPP